MKVLPPLLLTGLLLAVVALHAEGPLTPPGPPGPTMKSLQELWDKIGELEAQNNAIIARLNNLATALSPITTASAAC